MAEIGGVEYLAYLATNNFSFANILYYGKLIRDLALRSSLEVSQQLVEKVNGIDLEISVSEHIE